MIKTGTLWHEISGQTLPILPEMAFFPLFPGIFMSAMPRHK
jgi:hypothetical protein